MDKECFLLDESFIARCLVGMPEAIEAWKLILEKCHPLALRNDLVEKYYDLCNNKVRNPSQRFNVIHWLNISVRQEGKADWREDAPPIAQGPVRHQNDHYLLEIAARGGAVLVTTDPPTREDFNKPDTSQEFGVQGLTIEEALERLRQSDP